MRAGRADAVAAGAMTPGKLVVLSDYVGSGLGSAAGGAGIAALDGYRALQDSGMNVRLITGFGDASATGRSLGGRDLRTAGAVRSLATVHNPAAASALADLLRDEDPTRTLILLHQWTRWLSPAAIAACRRFPLIVYMHDYFWMCPNGAYFDMRLGEPCTRTPGGLACIAARCDRKGRAHKLVRIARHGALRLAGRNAAPRAFLHISEAARAVAAPLLAGRHAVIYNPMTRPPGHAPATDASYDIGYFGRLEAEKGVRMLASAMAGRGLRGLFVGEGALGEWLAAQPGITVAPWAPRDAVAGLMRSCRVIVLPSLWRETWGLVVPEAMAAGVPVLVSGRAGATELVDRFGGGLVFDPGSAAALDEALLAIRERRFPAPLDEAGSAALADFLAPARHAAAIATLARETFGIDVRLRSAPRPFQRSGVPRPPAM